MEAVCTSETSVDNQRTPQRYIPGDRTLHNHRFENLKSNMGEPGFSANFERKILSEFIKRNCCLLVCLYTHVLPSKLLKGLLLNIS
jgi:hypothetical protein